MRIITSCFLFYFTGIFTINLSASNILSTKQLPIFQFSNHMVVETRHALSLQSLRDTLPLRDTVSLRSQQARDVLSLTVFEKSPQLHRGRIWGLSLTSATAYTTTMVSLQRVWYSQFERTKFHFFNDNAEWNQMDKVGHAWTAYAEAWYGMDLFRWAGVKRKPAVWIGGAVASFFQLNIEILDGFSKRWGASIGDIAANTSGAALLVGQELLWEEQRIWLKFSSHRVNYSGFEETVQRRINDLYGTSFQELILKDYNGQTYWLSVNPYSFMKNENTRFPKWLNIAVGYGAGGLLGGFRNEWEDEEGKLIAYHNIERYRQFYLSLDIDLTKIKTKSKFLQFLFGTFNILKIPAPALEWNTKGEFKGHWLYW